MNSKLYIDRHKKGHLDRKPLRIYFIMTIGPWNLEKNHQLCKTHLERCGIEYEQTLGAEDGLCLQMEVAYLTAWEDYVLLEIGTEETYEWEAGQNSLQSWLDSHIQ